MKIGRILLALCVLCLAIPLGVVPVSAAAPCITLDRTAYTATDTITVTYSGTDANDWTGLYPYGKLPGGGENSLKWQYTAGSGAVTFSAADLNGPGEYTAYLCDNDGYTVLSMAPFTILNNETTNYGVTSAAVQAAVTSGKSTLSVTVTPSSAAELTYRFYWAKNGVRLADYKPIKEITHSGSGAFTVKCNDCLFMPDAADSIEVAVAEGRSTSYFVTTSALKLKPSTLRYSFELITDLHVSSTQPRHNVNFKQALRDIAATAPNSMAIFTAGDNTDNGRQDQYELLASLIAEAGVTLPPIYWTMGNHDQVYGGTYDEEIARFLQNTNMPGLYYSVDLNGTRFIVLGSNVQTTNGGLNATQLSWLRAKLAETDPSKPVFLFLHQSLQNTVSGSLTALNPSVQYWHLPAENGGDELRAILKNYPNAVFFSGHSHWSFEMIQPFLYGDGIDANFINGASVGYLWSDANVQVPGSEGLYIEVYEDYVLIKGREFTQGRWCAAAQFCVPIKKTVGQVYEGSLMADNADDWTRDSSVMQVEKGTYATTFYNTDGQWPMAEYTLSDPITFDPNTTTLYADLLLEKNAKTNLCLVGKNGVSLSLSPYIPLEANDVGDLIGTGKRVRAAINLSDVAFDAAFYNDSGAVTVNQMRAFASGDANAKLKVYDLSLVQDRSAKAVSLMNPDTLSAADPTKQGGYSYQNGRLTVTADTASGYQVTFGLNETYPVALLKNLLLKAQATAPFDVSLNVTTSGADTAFSLSGDFWPSLTTALENGYIPAGSYEKAIDFYSAYTYNQLAPANGRSTVKAVTITLKSAGTITFDALQLSSVTGIAAMPDDMTAQKISGGVPGDVDGNGSLTSTDIRMILRFTVGGSLTPEQQAIADVTGDGQVTSRDVRELLKTLIG
ncbi:MAG: metallophosphoesterase [Clostridia bacterium]|nr:metallophosphoesterase [Clostridia bacterium]